MHSTEIRLFAIIALVEGAKMKSESLKVSIVNVTFGNDSPSSGIALFFCRLHSHFGNLALFIDVRVKKLAQSRNVVRSLVFGIFILLLRGCIHGQLDFSFAAGAIKIAKADAKGAATML